MRYTIVLISLIALLVIACGGAGGKQPTSTVDLRDTQAPSEAQAVDIGDLLLRPEDVPPGLGQLSEPVVGGEEPSAEQRATFGIVNAAFQAYVGPGPYPERAARFMQASVALARADDGAKALFAATKADLDRQSIEGYEAQPGFDVLEYHEVSDLAPGDESRTVRYISENPGDAVRLETYWFVFRRQRAVAALQIKAREGIVGLEQVRTIAANFDRRIQEGLRHPVNTPAPSAAQETVNKLRSIADSLPVYPGATLVQEWLDATNLDLRLFYALSADTSQVIPFYEEQLTAAGWVLQPIITPDQNSPKDQEVRRTFTMNDLRVQVYLRADLYTPDPDEIFVTPVASPPAGAAGYAVVDIASVNLTQ